MGFERYLPLDAALDLPLDPNLHHWVANLDLEFYRQFKHSGGVADLRDLSERDLYLHFLQRGFQEGRPYNRHFFSFLDPRDYAHRYPELGLRDDGDAIRHWMYRGVFERRIPNKMTQDMLDADVHLFQMGKVGSKAIEKSLLQAGHRRLVPHLHWASEIVQSYTQCFYAYDEILNRDPHKKLVFISGVREPIERLISGLFQSATEQKSSLQIDGLTRLLSGSQASVEEFLAPHLKFLLEWFSHGYFRGIDVYEHAFDVERGYGVIEKGPVTVFLYRLDALDRCWAPLSEILGRKILPAMANETVSKSHAREMRESLKLMDSRTQGALRERISASPYWRHFFSDGSDAGRSDTRRSAHRSGGDADSTELRQPSGLPSDAALLVPDATALADRWARLDLAVRSSLQEPPQCELLMHQGAEFEQRPCGRIRLTPDSRGRVRFYFRVPRGCGRLLLGPADPNADFTVVAFTVRPLGFLRVFFAVVLHEYSLAPVWLARKLWRAMRAARIGGWASFGAHFLDNLERNIAGYGFSWDPGAPAQRACRVKPPRPDDAA
jgi:hypothetical protein